MNSAEIVVQSAKFISKSTEVQSTEVDANAENETLTLTFPQNLPIGTGKVVLEFTGILDDKLRGFYRSAYTG